ncbi:hypothetical protein HNR46_003672 [Haloferula luteola]|uniref:Uncharacterized protein n=1 Tax=Haloferula luteola TaxID=595692 RepID=A0A840V5W7_9BACT|nr:hypothetical protein [Haloferula luteola]
MVSPIERMLVVITTLLDPDLHDALEVAGLYPAGGTSN